MTKNLRNSAFIFLLLGLVGCGPSKFFQERLLSSNASGAPSLEIPQAVVDRPQPAPADDSGLTCGLILLGALLVSGLVAAFCYPRSIISFRDWVSRKSEFVWVKINSFRKR